eukprot:gb/GECG01004895.1/.p1 GENE.gb/GECG01004895.1/~~gb/GECG01004895.1/.p1  ORF type:complete len:173 (+),score=25.64 gb/GECG01004895.1/:1-519(+)
MKTCASVLAVLLVLFVGANAAAFDMEAKWKLDGETSDGEPICSSIDASSGKNETGKTCSFGSGVEAEGEETGCVDLEITDIGTKDNFGFVEVKANDEFYICYFVEFDGEDEPTGNGRLGSAETEGGCADEHTGTSYTVKKGYECSEAGATLVTSIFVMMGAVAAAIRHQSNF